MLAYVLGRWVAGLDGLELLAVVVTSALPTAQNVLVYASAYDRGTLLARDTILLSTVLSVPVLVLTALDAGRLAALPAHAHVVNVCRGSTVDEEALLAALVDGGIAGAPLDVTAVEPLPADSPLWLAPNLVLTPHAAGGRPVGADELIAHDPAVSGDGDARGGA